MCDENDQPLDKFEIPTIIVQAVIEASYLGYSDVFGLLCHEP